MKSIMYHYVREFDSKQPYFIYLDVVNFEKQLNWFLQNFNILSRIEYETSLEEKIAPKNSIILTFDDGLSDHYKYVFPILKKMGLWAIFFVSSEPLEKRNMLNVHKIHYLLGKYGGDIVLDALNSLISDNVFVDNYNYRFNDSTYVKQVADTSTSNVKRIINYYIKPELKDKILLDLFEYFKESETVISSDFYLNKDQINEMIDAGLSIGSHAHTHNLLSNLSYSEQKEEVRKSFAILNKITGNRVFPSFCYPYGGKNSYNSKTIEILKNENVRSSFIVRSESVENSDLMYSKYEIPRFDCNEFPYGLASGLIG